MTSSMRLFLDHAGPAFGEPPGDVQPRDLFPDFKGRQHLDDLISLLQKRNGFQAFDGALHVFPLASTPRSIGLREWNAPDLWKADFKGAADDLVFFAQDAFGFQYGFADDGIALFDPEVGHVDSVVGRTLDEWMDLVCSDPDVHTGRSLWAAWQEYNGAVPNKKRLAPTIPFVLGGDYSVENLKAVDQIDCMRFRGSLSCQIRDLPDGAQIRFRMTD